MTGSAALAPNGGYWTFLDSLEDTDPVRSIRLKLCEGDLLISELKRCPEISFGAFSVNFESDCWDFTKVTDLNVGKSALRFHFREGPMKDQLKLYAITGVIWRTAKVQTIKTKCLICEAAFSSLRLTSQGVRLLSRSDVESYVSTLRSSLAPSSLGNHCAVLADFLEFHEGLFGRMVDPEAVPFLRKTASLCADMAKVSDGFPCIPPDYEAALLDVADAVMRDESADQVDAVTAGVIRLLSDVGFRSCECLGLEIDALEVVKGVAGLPDIAYLTFKTYKGEAGDGSYALRRTVISAKALEAYLYLTEKCERRRQKLGVSTLVVYPQQRERFCSGNALARHIRCFLVRYSALVPSVNSGDRYPELPVSSVEKAVRASRLREELGDLGLAPGDALSYVTPHMFRVTFATKLYELGYDLAVISEFMNHISSNTTVGYIRAEKRIEREACDLVYRTLLVDGAELLGPHGEEFSALVEDYAANLKGTVYEDEDELIAACSERYPLRLKPGYVCTKCGSIRGCPSDSGTDEVFCAFGVCQNQHHMYFMLDVHLESARFHMRLVEENCARGHVMAAKNELRKARNVIEGTVLPELASLDEQLVRHGEAHVLGRHPHLTPIARDRSAISEEVGSWLSVDLPD